MSMINGRKTIYATSTVNDKIVHATVQVTGFTQFESVTIVSRNGDKVIVDKDALDALIIALQGAREQIKYQTWDL
jgi:hypothetical protein